MTEINLTVPDTSLPRNRPSSNDINEADGDILNASVTTTTSAASVEPERSTNGTRSDSEDDSLMTENGYFRSKKIVPHSMTSNFSITSAQSSVLGDVDLRCSGKRTARQSVMAALSVLYAFTMILFGLVMELAHLLSAKRNLVVQIEEFVFSTYMYGGSIIFFLYCYLILLFDIKLSAFFKRLGRWFKRKRTKSDIADLPDFPPTNLSLTSVPKVTHDSASTGSLFLRIGCIIFGVISTVYYGFTALLCVNDSDCHTGRLAANLIAMVFVFIQMHFIFCNQNIRIVGHVIIARFGLMHLVAVNLWSWLKYILIEETILDEEIQELFGIGAEASAEDGSKNITHVSPFSDVLSTVKNIMYASIVEYSLIAAVVLLIVWKNIDHKFEASSGYTKRKHQIRIDCSQTTCGFFAGIAFMVYTFSLITLYCAFSVIHENYMAAIAFSIADITQYLLMIIMCVAALWQMRLLQYHPSHSEKKKSQELLDQLLLAFGMGGEMIYSLAGLLGLSSGAQWQSLFFTLLFSHITRLIQVWLQSFLIFMAANFRLPADPKLRRRQPGKQIFTFLLVANLCMFFMNLLESQQAGINEFVVDFYGRKSWVFLVRSFGPLTVFYRFHSSACIAEVWKNMYALKD